MHFNRKGEDELAWMLIKAAVRSKVNLEIADYRNRRMNDILSEIWPAFEASLMGEEVLTIDPEYATWVRDALREVPTAVEAY